MCNTFRFNNSFKKQFWATILSIEQPGHKLDTWRQWRGCKMSILQHTLLCSAKHLKGSSSVYTVLYVFVCVGSLFQAVTEQLQSFKDALLPLQKYTFLLSALTLLIIQEWWNFICGILLHYLISSYPYNPFFHLGWYWMWAEKQRDKYI